MTKAEDNAFPLQVPIDLHPNTGIPVNYIVHPGMSMREYYAGQAMAAIIGAAPYPPIGYSVEAMARNAIAAADALIKELGDAEDTKEN